jgi:hypothetical protein
VPSLAIGCRWWGEQTFVVGTPVCGGHSKMLTNFYSRMWFRYVGAAVCTLLAMFCLVFGPLFLLDILRPANGNPGKDAGVAMSIMLLPMSLVMALSWFNVAVRRKPLLRICREGIEVNVIGSSSLDGVPLVPPLIRIAWLVISLRKSPGFHGQCFVASCWSARPWRDRWSSTGQ